MRRRRRRERWQAGAQEVTRAAGALKRPPDTEAVVVEPVDGGVPDPKGRAEVARNVVPGTAANNPDPAIFVCNSRSIRRRTAVAFFVAVLDPLPHIAMHVV